MTDSTSRRPRGVWSRWAVRPSLAVIGAICLSAAFVAIVAGGLAIAHLSAARWTLVDRLDPALLNAQALSAALINQETGIRGFAATGNRDFLAPYRQGRQQEDSALAILRRLGAAQPPTQLTH